tara:strand:- start:159 stop:314 length:156 start_codon:yes stop_codon:yes gene_type:complete
MNILVVMYYLLGIAAVIVLSSIVAVVVLTRLLAKTIPDIKNNDIADSDIEL